VVPGTCKAVKVAALQEAAAKATRALQLQAKRKAAQQTVARIEEDSRKRLEERLNKPKPHVVSKSAQ
jgi:hypothetical protein